MVPQSSDSSEREQFSTNSRDNGYRHRRCEHQPKLETRYSGFYYDDDYLLPALSSRTELAPHGHPGHNSALSTVIFSSGMSQSIKTAGNFPSVSHGMES